MTSFWDACLDSAIRDGDIHKLASIILTDDGRLVPARVMGRGLLLPNGRPKSCHVHGAGEELLLRVGLASEDDRWAFEALAEKALGVWGRHREGTREERLQEGYAHICRAVAIASDKDPLFEAILLGMKAARERNMLQNDKSLATAEDMVRILSETDSTLDDSSVLYSLAPGTVRPADEARIRLLEHAYTRAHIAARMLRRYTLAVEYLDKCVAAAEALLSKQPELAAVALGERASLARQLGDLKTSDEMLRRQRKIAEEYDWRLAKRRVLTSMANEAEFFDDFDLARECLLKRVALQLDIHPQASSKIPADSMEWVTPAAVNQSIDSYRAGPSQLRLTGLGDTCYSLAKNLIMSGQCATYFASRIEAGRWLDTADRLWDDVGMNGLIALEFQRLRLALLEQDGVTPEEAGAQMLRLSREWRRPLGQRGAAMRAAVDGAAGDLAVRERLAELRQEAPPIDAAHLDLALGQWSLRAAGAAAACGDTASARQRWREAVTFGLASAEGLSVPSTEGQLIFLNTSRYVDAVAVASDAMSRARNSLIGEETWSEGEELCVRLLGLPAISKLFLAARTPSRRELIARQRKDLLAETADLALRLGDFDALDAACETARRDSSSGVLFAIANDEHSNQELAMAARMALAALNAAVTDQEDSDSESSPSAREDPRAEDDSQNALPVNSRAITIQEQFNETLDAFDRIVGPTARAIFNPAVTSSATADSLLRVPGAPEAVLSLWLRDDGSLVRHAAWRTAEGVEHYADAVSSPQWLPVLARDGLANQARLGTYLRLLAKDEVLVPAQLRHLLVAAPPEEPTELLVIPTGLLSVPFAGLPLADGGLLIEHASVTVMPSLLGSIALLPCQAESFESSLPPALAVFDTKGLVHARAEYEALCKCFTDIKEIQSLEELDAALAAAKVPGWRGMIAMAIHGVPGHHGWSQKKTLPNGDSLVPSHVLQWPMPVLAVLASCLTDVHEDAAGDLGGFPLAFQLRGTQLVVGTLSFVDDEATMQIMSRLYEALSRGLSPAKALREAQLEWIGESTGRKEQLALWAFHVAYGIDASS
jgi:hypothetical protein